MSIRKCQCRCCKRHENLGVWGLPADSSKSFKLDYTVEQLTEIMRNNKDKIAEAMQKIQVPGPLHIKGKSYP